MKWVKKIPSDVRAKIESALNDLKATLKDENATKEAIDSKVQALSKVAEDMYKAAASQNAGANNAGADNKSGKKNDDDVIDAEVE